MTKQGTTKPLTVGQHHSRIAAAHRSGEGWQVKAGTAVVEAIDAGALYFGKVAPEGTPEGAHSRASLAKHLGTSPTTVSKYRTIGYAVRMGFTPEHADWATITGSHSAAWLVEAILTGKRATVDKALADHRKGSQVNQGGATTGKTKGKGKGTDNGATPDSRNNQPGDSTPKRANIGAKVASAAGWLSANNGSRLSGLSATELDSILANLTAARDAVEGEIQRRKADKSLRPTG